MAILPLSGTNVRLLSGVPFSKDYKNSRWFDSKTEQTTYFTNKPTVHAMTQSNFQRIEGKHFIAVNLSIDELWKTSYLMFQNAQYSNKWFYAFVTKLEYKQRNTTWVHFELDVLQTWLAEMKFKPSFVIREHCKLWNSDGSPVLNTVDEGLNYGAEYELADVSNYTPYGDVLFLVVVAKKAMHYAEGAKVDEITPVLNGLPQPLSYYIHPFKLDGTTPKVNIGSIQDYTINPILDVLKSLYEQDDSVNNIVSLYVTEHIGYNFSTGSDGSLNFDDTSFGQGTIADNDSKKIQTIYVKEISRYVSSSKTLGNKYEGYASVKESKLLMYPYTVLILDDFKGSRQVLKNEYIRGNTLNLAVQGSIGTSNKVSYNASNYLKDSQTPYNNVVSLEHSVINNNPSDIPILSDYLSAYLQGNRNSIENQKNSIVWNGVMGAVGSAIGIGSAVSGKNVSLDGAASSGAALVGGIGNSVLEIQGIEAKQQDIANIPPQLVKMGSNTAFDFGNNIKGLTIIKKQITAEYRRKLTDFFNMFGYKLNEVKIPNFHTRTKWNYVQTAACTITGDLPNEDLLELKAVFDNGITLWHTDDIGNYELENEVI